VDKSAPFKSVNVDDKLDCLHSDSVYWHWVVYIECESKAYTPDYV